MQSKEKKAGTPKKFHHPKSRKTLACNIAIPCAFQESARPLKAGATGISGNRVEEIFFTFPYFPQSSLQPAHSGIFHDCAQEPERPTHAAPR